MTMARGVLAVVYRVVVPEAVGVEVTAGVVVVVIEAAVVVAVVVIVNTVAFALDVLLVLVVVVVMVVGAKCGDLFFLVEEANRRKGEKNITSQFFFVLAFCRPVF